jgi:hypothetical protein
VAIGEADDHAGEEDHRFADSQFLGYLTDRCQGGRWELVE